MRHDQGDVRPALRILLDRLFERADTFRDIAPRNLRSAKLGAEPRIARIPGDRAFEVADRRAHVTALRQRRTQHGEELRVPAARSVGDGLQRPHRLRRLTDLDLRRGEQLARFEIVGRLGHVPGQEQQGLLVLPQLVVGGARDEHARRMRGGDVKRDLAMPLGGLVILAVKAASARR